jgi:hypothetical protein
MNKKPPPKKPRSMGANVSEDIQQAFSDLELLAAAGVIRSAIDEGRKHVDQPALKRVYAKLMTAYESRAQARAAKQRAGGDVDVKRARTA